MCRIICECVDRPEMLGSARIVCFVLENKAMLESMWLFQGRFQSPWRQQNPVLATFRNKPNHTRRWKATGFRGKLASASLKHPVQHLACGHRHEGFRGKLASASLKPSALPRSFSSD